VAASRPDGSRQNRAGAAECKRGPRRGNRPRTASLPACPGWSTRHPARLPPHQRPRPVRSPAGADPGARGRIRKPSGGWKPAG